MATARRSPSLVQRTFSPVSQNLGHKVANGAAFTMLGIVFRTLLTIGSMAILARLLSPTDFGHIAMTTVITEFAALFSNLGFSAILIQRPKIARIQMDSIFWASIALGVFLTATVFALSFFTEHIFNDVVVGSLLQCVCLVFLLEELTVVPRALLARLLMFRQDFYVQALVMLTRSGSAVLLAYQGFGVWALAIGPLIGGLVQAVAYLWITKYWPRLRTHRAFLRAIRGTNSAYFGNGILFYINSNLDLFLIGRLLGATSLGYYQNARSLTDEVRNRIAIPLQRVLFPAFAAVQNDIDRFRNGILRSGRLLSLIVIPIGFGIAAVAEELVPLLYGQQWITMIPLLKILSVGCGLNAASTVGTLIFNATDRMGLAFRLSFAATTIGIVSTIIGSHWGLIGVAYAMLFNSLVTVVFFRIGLGLVGLGTLDLLKILGAPCLASILMLIAVTYARAFIHGAIDVLVLRLIALIFIGALTYVIAVPCIAPGFLRDVKDLLAKFSKRRHP